MQRWRCYPLASTQHFVAHFNRSDKRRGEGRNRIRSGDGCSGGFPQPFETPPDTDNRYSLLFISPRVFFPALSLQPCSRLQANPLSQCVAVRLFIVCPWHETANYSPDLLTGSRARAACSMLICVCAEIDTGACKYDCWLCKYTGNDEMDDRELRPVRFAPTRGGRLEVRLLHGHGGVSWYASPFNVVLVVTCKLTGLVLS